MPFTTLNGRLPDSVLTNLPWPEADYLRLRADAAASLGRLAVAFKQVFGRPLLLTDAYRTFVQQESLKIQKGVWAATPGTSVHGLGLAVDLASNINSDWTPEHRWMVANAGRFGWVNPLWAIDQNPLNGQHEPWHWEYHPELDITPAAIPAPPAIQEDEMRIITQPERGAWLMGAGFAHHFTPEEWSQFQQYPHGLTVTTIPAGGAGQVVFDMHRTIYTKQAHA